MIGQTLDRYRIEAKIGEGGMGVVYKARDTQLDRPVAIKVLAPDCIADQERLQRFSREARAASALNHPGIVTVYDIRHERSVDFIVMEYLDGTTLDRIIPAKGLPVARALGYAVQIADALASAHGVGIVHRDLKPLNVMVTRDDRVKVVDFGLAKLLESDSERTGATRTELMTEAGRVMGTAAYMSPEQAEGRPVDTRSDTFSFGIILYEMLTGQRPFAGESNVAVLAKIIAADPPPPASINPAIPSELDRLVLRCLRRDPSRRFQTMSDLKSAIEDLQSDTTLTTSANATPAPRRTRTAWTLAMIAVVVAGLGYAWWYMTAASAPDSGAGYAVPLTTLPGIESSPTWSADGNQVAFSWGGNDETNEDIYVMQVGATTQLRLTTDPALDYSPAWSPDGRAIAFLRAPSGGQQHELRLVPPLGGPERKIADIAPRGFLRQVTLAWCPDSSCVLATDKAGDGDFDALFAISIDSREKRQIMSPKGFLADTDPAISPDGKWLAFRRDTAPFSGQLMLASLADGVKVSGEPRPITDTLLTAYSPQWMSDTELVFSAKGALWRASTSAGSVPSRLPFGEDGRMPAWWLGPAGQRRLAYVRSSRDLNIWRLNLRAAGAAATSPPTAIITSTRIDNLPALSFDSERIAFQSYRSGENEVWVADISGANAAQLTSLGANPGYPAWSPDGSQIAFHSNGADHATGNVYLMSADGGVPRNLTPDTRTNTFPHFSQDGRWIYFSSTRGGNGLGTWKIPPAGGEPVRVGTGQGLRPIESPNGHWIYYIDTPQLNRPGRLMREPLGGGPAIALASAVLASNYDVVDRGVYYLEGGYDAALKFIDAATGDITTIAEHLGVVGALSVSRDGRTVIYHRLDAAVDDLMLVDNVR